MKLRPGKIRSVELPMSENKAQVFHASASRNDKVGLSVNFRLESECKQFIVADVINEIEIYPQTSVVIYP